MLDRFAEQALELASHRAEQAEIYAVSSQETPVSFEANRLKQIRTTLSHSLTLRVIAEGRIGLASTTRLDAAQALVDDALALAPFGSRAHFDLPSDSPPHDVPSYDPSLAEQSLEGLIEIGQAVITGITAQTPGVVCSLDINKYVAEVVIQNTRGCRASFRKTFLLLHLQASLIQSHDIILVRDGDASCRQPLDHAGLIQRVANQFALPRHSVEITSGEMPVVFTPKGFAYTLLPSLQEALNGERVLQGLSPLADRLGDEVADRRFSLHDNGRVDYSPRAYPCDGEGVPTQCTPLLDQGMVKNFIYDLQTAALAGTQSTGSGWRLPGEKPSPTPAAAIIAEGKTPYADMLAGIREGILVDQTLSAPADGEGGDFAAQIDLGYKIERGEIVGRIKNGAISGNLLDALANLSAIGDQAVWVAGSYKVPYLCFGSLSVTGAG
jgi:PmbA protein